MRIRTGHGPNDWRDDGPQTAVSRVNHYSVGANTGAAMVPMPVSTNLGATPAEMVRRARKRQKRQDAARILRELNAS